MRSAVVLALSPLGSAIGFRSSATSGAVLPVVAAYTAKYAVMRIDRFMVGVRGTPAAIGLAFVKNASPSSASLATTARMSETTVSSALLTMADFRPSSASRTHTGLENCASENTSLSASIHFPSASRRRSVAVRAKVLVAVSTV